MKIHIIFSYSQGLQQVGTPRKKCLATGLVTTFPDEKKKGLLGGA